MPDEIQSLIDSLRRGQYENPAEKIKLLSAALQEHHADISLLLALLGAPQISLRLAALDACRERTEPELIAEVITLTQDTEPRIRQKLAEILRRHTGQGPNDALKSLAADDEEDVREAALKSTTGRPEFRILQESTLAQDHDWNVRFAASDALEAQESPVVVKALLEAVVRDTDDDVQRHCAEIIEKRLHVAPGPTEQHLPADVSLLSRAEKILKALGAHRFPRLLAWVTARTTVSVDPEVLARFGTDLSAQALNGILPRGFAIEENCLALLQLIQREPRRSIALLGAAGVGKTALVQELVYELAKPESGGWRVLRVSPADFMSGTKYLGEWETKVRELVQAIRQPRRVLLYVPNLSDLSAAGSWAKSDSSVASALGPYLEDGSVLLLGESTPEEFERGLGKVPSLARLFDKVLLSEPSLEGTRAILGAVRTHEQSKLHDGVLDQLLDLSNQFSSHVNRPGNAMSLLQSALKMERDLGRPVVFRDILNRLSESTGIPADLLDDSIPLDAAQVRQFFESKIKGQPEAVDAMIDLVTLIKAGVTDPNKPFAVFLFVGPTGVGKTELARTLAEFIFGDAARLKRFDMSEFASTDGFTRLIGSNNENGFLTDAVRQHPFSVVLLDEIEKAHVNVFDLCLQIFDAGRLTDGRGRTVDFRRTIVILTSNIGATAATTPLGFGATQPAATAPADVDQDRTFRELSRFFRPEFLNRLDRIIPFRPLTLQIAEQIARSEIDVVLQRSGIRRRQLAVDIDPSVISLLVREGYSPHFGARPLKRTVERLLLLPLARAISSGSLKEQSILRLAEREGRVTAAITEPPSPPHADQGPQIEEPAPELHERLRQLQTLYLTVQDAIQPLADRKSELILQTQRPDFFRNASQRTATLGEIHNLDQFLNLHGNLRKALSILEEQFSRKAVAKSGESALRARLERLAAEIDHLQLVARCQDARELGDAVLLVTLVDRTGKPQGGVTKLAAMYQAFASRRRMSAEVLGEFYNERHDRVCLLLAGLGAYLLLKDEYGLHQIDRRFKERTPRAGREVIREDRELVRVEVYPAATVVPNISRSKIRSKLTALHPSRTRLLKADYSVSLFDETTLRSVELWTSGPKQEAADRAFLLLDSQTAAPTSPASLDTIVRRYDLGMSPRIKDTRTGRTSTRVEEILDGELGLFLARP